MQFPNFTSSESESIVVLQAVNCSAGSVQELSGTQQLSQGIWMRNHLVLRCLLTVRASPLFPRRSVCRNAFVLPSTSRVADFQAAFAHAGLPLTVMGQLAVSPSRLAVSSGMAAASMVFHLNRLRLSIRLAHLPLPGCTWPSLGHQIFPSGRDFLSHFGVGAEHRTTKSLPTLRNSLDQTRHRRGQTGLRPGTGVGTGPRRRRQHHM